MNDLPLVSLLMTSYNREKYIGFAIESVMASTYSNWELIIVDDRSSDKTLDIAREYEKKDKRIKVYLNEKNLGDYPNRNKAASYAKGKYIKYVDADDAIYPWAVQAEVEMMEKFPEAAYGLDSLIQDDTKMYPILLTPREAYFSHFVKRTGMFHKAPTSSMIKREVFLRENGFRELRMVGDNEMWLRLSLKYSVLIMPDGMIWSRGHEESESGKLMNKPFITYHYILVQRQYLEHPDCPLDEPDRKRMHTLLSKSQLKILVRLLLAGKFDIYKRIRNLDSIRFSKLLWIALGLSQNPTSRQSTQAQIR